MTPDEQQPFWIHWGVTVVDRATRSLRRRELYLDLSRLPEVQQAEIRDILAAEASGMQMLRYRSLFEERRMPASSSDLRAMHRGRFRSVTFRGDYFEDEEGNPLGELEAVQALAGTDDIVLAGNPASVMRHGPSTFIRADTWSTQKANDVAHFLEVVRLLRESEWRGTKVSVQYTLGPDGAQQVLGFSCPSVFVLYGVLLLLRQLVSKDRVLERATDAYLEHVGDGRKRWYVEERRDLLKDALRRPSLFAPGRTSLQVIDLLFYGLGLVHPPRPRQADKFRRVLGSLGRENVFLAFQSCSQQVACVAMNVEHVIRQDFSHWMASGNIAGPDRVGIQDVFESHP